MIHLKRVVDANCRPVNDRAGAVASHRERFASCAIAAQWEPSTVFADASMQGAW
jgi:hypothetical protein